MTVSYTALSHPQIYPQRFTRLGVKENGTAVQRAVNQLSDLKRS